VIHLDTSFLIRALVPGSEPDSELRGWLRDGTPIGMSVIAWAELLCGPISRAQLTLAAQVVPKRAPFLEEQAELAAGLFNRSGRRRGSLADCMIAATAIHHEVALATSSPGDFRPFESAGLSILPERE